MASLSLKYRIAVIIFLLEAVMMSAVLGTSLSQYLKANRRQSHTNEHVLLNLLADSSRAPLITSEYDELQPYIEKVIEDPHVKKIFLTDNHNRIVVSSNIKDIGTPRPNLDNSGETFWRTKKIVNSAGVLGEIAINFSHAQLLQANRKALDLGIGIALAGMIMIAVFGTFVGYLLTRRLEKLKNAALQLANGDITVKVQMPGRDEVAIVGQAFDQMARSVENHMEELRSRELELRKAYDLLEERIRERTIELAVARDQALESSRVKSAFLANMSHELRTPLNAIIGYSDILVDEAEEFGYEELIEDLRKIRTAGTHLLQLISDVLDLSRIEAGKVEFHIETINIKSLINEVISTIQPLVDKNANVLHVHCGDDAGFMRADAVKVSQTLINLLGNAAKFTETGQINLTVSRHCEHGFNWIHFEVQDTGIGIAGEQLKNLFKEFNQADISPTRKFGGTGLGLTISRRFCRMMGGDITATSELGKGSKFTVKLPSDVDIQNAEVLIDPDREFDPKTVRFNDGIQEHRSQEERRTRVAKVLIVDDDLDVRNLLSTALNTLGFNTITAESGQLGITLARYHIPDAIILDVLMPDMDGRVVLNTLKNDLNTASIPVILLTVDEEEGLGCALGAKFFLRKPLNLYLLEQAVKSCVRQSEWQTEKIFEKSAT